MPAPKGNRNAFRHGLHAGKLAKSCRYVTNAVNQLRRQLEDEMTSRHGEINVYRAALIQSCVRHETRAKLLQRWLRMNEMPAGNGKDGDGKSLSVLDKAQLLKQISDATDARDRCLERMGLDRDQQPEWWGALGNVSDQQPDAPQPPASQDDQRIKQPNENASRGRVEPQEASEEEAEQ